MHFKYDTSLCWKVTHKSTPVITMHCKGNGNITVNEREFNIYLKIKECFPQVLDITDISARQIYSL